MMRLTRNSRTKCSMRLDPWLIRLGFPQNFNSRPATAIVETAKLKGCDLIVMASHGRRGLRKLFL
jgi:Universal stress protein family